LPQPASFLSPGIQRVVDRWTVIQVNLDDLLKNETVVIDIQRCLLVELVHFPMLFNTWRAVKENWWANYCTD